MRRADRLFQIVQMLRSGRLATARSLSEALEVSERTIYRDIADLQASGVPIDGEAGVGYVMGAGYDLPPIMFTRNEVSALAAGARLLRAWGGSAMAKSVESAMSKIEAVLPDQRRSDMDVEVHALAFEMTPEIKEMMDVLEEAVQEREIVTLHYHDGKARQTQRDVRPLTLLFWGKVWTLVAWCHLRGDFRMFRVDRISEAIPTGVYFESEEDKSITTFLRQSEEKYGPYPGYSA